MERSTRPSISIWDRWILPPTQGRYPECPGRVRGYKDFPIVAEDRQKTCPLPLPPGPRSGPEPRVPAACSSKKHRQEWPDGPEEWPPQLPTRGPATCSECERALERWS